MLVAASGLFTFRRSQRAAASVQYTREVIARANNLARLIVDMETGERGFLIAGRDEFLEPFNASQIRIHYAHIRTMLCSGGRLPEAVAGHPVIQAHFEKPPDAAALSEAVFGEGDVPEAA